MLPARTKYAKGCHCEACEKVEEYIRRLRASTAEMVERQSERITVKIWKWSFTDPEGLVNTSQTIANLPATDSRWLARLDARLWQKHKDETHGETRSPKGKVTKDEYRRLLKLVKTYQLPCEMHACVYGEVCLAIYTHAPLPDLKPERLLSFSLEHLPIRVRMHFGNQLQTAKRFFGPLVHNRRNLELLGFYKLEKPREWSYYEY